MRDKFINFLKNNIFIQNVFYFLARTLLHVLSIFNKVNPKQIIFASFGGRKFDDSPKALYDEICNREEFKDYNLVWAFIEPDKFELTRGEKVKIDTFSFFKKLITSKIWISNSGMDRGIDFNRKGIIKVETWHGTPLKKICCDENGLKGKKIHMPKYDTKTIRCAQSEFDRDIFARIFNCSKDSILLSDLPRNDSLLRYSNEQLNDIKNKLNIPLNKKVILYTPTYREYLLNKDNLTYIAPPINLDKWKNKLGNKYVLLMRAHYAVNMALNIEDNDFVKNVSDYPCLNDLYAIADLMISDYSSTYFDYSILDRPIFCFAYDLEEYEEKRGLYLNIEESLPCRINKNEDDLIDDILTFDESVAIEKTREFHKKYLPNAGNASKVVVNEILERLK